MNSKQHALGQFETPPEVADLLAGLSIRRATDRVLDPSCAEGNQLAHNLRWQQWLSSLAPEHALVGIEHDSQAASQARVRCPSATVIDGNFLTMEAGERPLFDALTGNPPFTQTEIVGPDLEEEAQQLALFTWEESPEKSVRYPLISQRLAGLLGGRSPLHAYYLLHSTDFLSEGGRLAFIVPNGWLDVAYGQELKQYLLDHYRILAIIESAVERWFEEAWINTCIVLLEKCVNLPRRRGNLVHLVRLKKPLQQLLPYSAESAQRYVALERLIRRLLPGRTTVNDEADIHVKEQKTLRAEAKWGMVLRSPAVFRHHRDHLKLLPLRAWATVQRGYTTGANEFFYLTAADIQKWEIEQRFRRPLLKSLRNIERLQLSADDTHHEVLIVPPEGDLQGTAVGEYIRWGESKGFNGRRTCAGRQPWYWFPLQPAAPLVLPKGIWHRHLAPLLLDEMAVDQQLYQITVADYLPLTAVAALLNSAWFALQLELRGRVSFGKGLLWLAAYEIEEVQLPDPRLLSSEQVARLDYAFTQLSGRPIRDSLEELSRPDRRVLDDVVFDILGFSDFERAEVLGSLAERMASRQHHAV